MSRTKVSEAVRTSILTVIQTGVGCGLGLLIAGKLQRRSQKVTAATLFSVGFLLAIPGLVGVILRLWNRPESPRVARKTLDSIRSDSGFPDEANVI